MPDAWAVAEHSLHLLAMAVMVGGSAAMLLASPRRSVWLRFEWCFWAAAAVAVVTGVGNLGLRGSLPSPDSVWGTLFQVKLAGAGLLLAVSFARCALVVMRSGLIELRAASAATVLIATATAVLGVGVADA